MTWPIVSNTPKRFAGPADELQYWLRRNGVWKYIERRSARVFAYRFTPNDFVKLIRLDKQGRCSFDGVRGMTPEQCAERVLRCARNYL